MGIISNVFDIMALSNWAKVYYHNDFAGILEERPGGDYLFTYDDEFRKKQISISTQLPASKKEHLSRNGLHAFFDNLLAEGPLAKIQARALGVKSSERFKLLMAFGFDLIGAVSVIDPQPSYEVKIDADDYFQEISLRSRASISGVQAKLLVTKKRNGFRPVNYQEASSHIAKLSGGQFPLIIENEFLAMKATEILLFNDEVAEVQLSELENLGPALIVKRFDRNANAEKFHFEEFTQLMNIESDDKYFSSYSEMAQYIRQSRFCSKADLEKLFRRILACILLGNSDAHLKNFAMFRHRDSMSFTPVYDMVFTRFYPLADEMALDLVPKLKLRIQDIKVKHLKILAEHFAFDEAVLINIKNDFEKRLDDVFEFIESQTDLDSLLRDKFKEHIEKRWKALFKNIGRN